MKFATVFRVYYPPLFSPFHLFFPYISFPFSKLVFIRIVVIPRAMALHATFVENNPQIFVAFYYCLFNMGIMTVVARIGFVIVISDVAVKTRIWMVIVESKILIMLKCCGFP